MNQLQSRLTGNLQVRPLAGRGHCQRHSKNSSSHRTRLGICNIWGSVVLYGCSSNCTVRSRYVKIHILNAQDAQAFHAPDPTPLVHTPNPYPLEEIIFIWDHIHLRSCVPSFQPLHHHVAIHTRFLSHSCRYMHIMIMHIICICVQFLNLSSSCDAVGHVEQPHSQWAFGAGGPQAAVEATLKAKTLRASVASSGLFCWSLIPLDR